MLKGSELPSVRALRSFIVVAHHQSFSKAAQELCVTQGAVSKQIASLEQMVGQPLIIRHLNGLELTDSGRAYLPKVIEALEIIQHATISLKQSSLEQEQLIVDVPPSFASLWLLDKMDAFQQKYADIQVMIRTRDTAPNQTTVENDLAIRCLPIAHHYEHSHLLCRETLWLVAEGKMDDVTSLREVFEQNRLIPHTTRPQLWDYFTQQRQVNTPLKYHSVGYEHFYLSLEAVKRGKGLALVPDFLIKKLVVQGEVKHIQEQSISSGYGYYLTVPSYRLASRKVYLFCEWLKAELGKENE